MKALGLQTLALSAIDTDDRLRAVDEDHAQLLAQNIAQVGRMRQPIEVRQITRGTPRMILIAGGHRLRAAQILGWTEIDAFVFEATEDEARLAEIDENLVRHDLNPLDRAVFLAERKGLYEKLHPQTKNGAQGGRGAKKNESDTMSFSKDTANKCGWTDRTIQRAVFIASKLAADVRASLPGTALSKKQSELLALAKLPHSEQRAVLAVLFAAEPKTRSVEGARKLVQGGREAEVSATDTLFLKMTALWGRAGQTNDGRKAQRQFIAHLRESGALGAVSVDSEEKEAA